MKSILPAIVFVLCLAACERETEVHIPPQDPKLVAESRQGQGDRPEARISRTRSSTDPLPPYGSADPNVVKNAIVLLYENDIFRDTMKYNTTTEKYKAPTATIAAGKTYKVVMTAPGFPVAEALSLTPTLVQINNYTLTPNARNDRDGNPQDELKVVFNDNVGTEDYYLIRIKDAYGGFLYCVNTNDKDVEKLVYDDPLYPEECLQSDRLLISDVNFNGATKTLILFVSSGSISPQSVPGGINKATIELLHINKDYYRYIKSLNSYENAVDNPFAEPVNLYSNVKNGYGLFTTYARDVDSIQ
jgi:hypothetical protein